ncbi:MAG TPA: ATP-binding protein [Steroidobacteraceae bacterium]|nr:ATP-binding protein [Steroidobacteraceae bacterium]
MSSMRKGLTLWLWAAVALVGAVSVAIGYWQARKETQEQLDYQMQQVVHILAAQTFAPSAAVPKSAPAAVSPVVHISHDEDDDLIVSVRDQQGALLYASRANRQLSGSVLPALDSLGFRNVVLDGQAYRVFVAQSGDKRIEIAQSMDVIREAEEGVALATLLPILLLLPVLGVGIGFVIRRQLRPLNAVASLIASRPPLCLELLPVDALPREVRPLADEINRLLGRLKAAVHREQRFLTDAAHALRTPLTALQLQADVLDGARDPVEKAARLAQLRAGIRRVSRLSEQLLSLARSESTAGPLTVSTELDPALEEVIALHAAAAAAREISLQADTHSNARVYGNARRLTLILGNLLDNAVRYTPDGGQVRVRVETEENAARVEVWDEGCGLPPEELDRVFERFYRAPGDDSNGSGLGLATVDTLVRQLGGRVVLANRVDRPGLIATVTLPLASELAVASAQYAAS